MLVLTRKPQETICIGNNITITVIKTKGKAVRIGVEAPNDVTILRGELQSDSNEESDASTDNTTTGSKAAGPLSGIIAAEKKTAVQLSQQTLPMPPEESDVRHMRTSRSRIKTMLPQLLGDAGPLRELLDRRSEVLA